MNHATLVSLALIARWRMELRNESKRVFVAKGSMWISRSILPSSSVRWSGLCEERLQIDTFECGYRRLAMSVFVSTEVLGESSAIVRAISLLSVGSFASDCASGPRSSRSTSSTFPKRQR